MSKTTCGSCPKCGAPIYEGEPDSAGFPVPHFTCGCRFEFVTQPTPIRITYDPPPASPWTITYKYPANTTHPGGIYA